MQPLGGKGERCSIQEDGSYCIKANHTARNCNGYITRFHQAEEAVEQ